MLIDFLISEVIVEGEKEFFKKKTFCTKLGNNSEFHGKYLVFGNLVTGYCLC